MGPPSRMKITPHFEDVLRKRPYIRIEWCERIVANPMRVETQDDGHIRHWGRVAEDGNRIYRVVTLSDGETIHTAFPDRNFKE